MKKFLLLTAAAFVLLVKGFSQPCTPDISITKPGIFPDSATNLPHAVVGTPYSTVMQVRVPHDTTVIIFSQSINITIDSIVLKSFTGFPSGYTNACNPSTCN